MKKKKKLFVLIILLVLIISIFLVNTIFKNPLIGKWEGKGGTIYEFKNPGKGVMIVPLSKYEFTYKVKDGKLSIDYKDKKAYDATYKYKIKNNKLTLIGDRGKFTFTKK